jgi:hypothetical protein
VTTKAIREALSALGKVVGADMVDPALREVEAIERAAKALGTAYVGEVYGGATRTELNAAHDLMAAIAKDAP